MNTTCPNCGHPVDPSLPGAVMVTCPACGTTLHVTGAALERAGKGGEMHDAPLLFGVGDTVLLGRHEVTLHGHARYSYGRGWWDEFWGIEENGQGVWVSIDEGDIVLQRPKDGPPPNIQRGSEVGTEFEHDGEHYVLMERGTGEIVALRGTFGEMLEVGERVDYANAQSDQGDLLSIEFGRGPRRSFIGHWFDPFEVDLRRRDG